MSCHGTPLRTGFGGVLRNNSGLFLASFFGFLPNSDDIMLAELSALYHDLVLAKDLGYTELVCYSDSLVCTNLLNGPIERYHVYVVLLRNIKQLLLQSNITVSHTIREGNQCAYLMAKLEASFDDCLVLHDSPPAGLFDLLISDAAVTFNLQE